jgi:hypothetical protein
MLYIAPRGVGGCSGNLHILFVSPVRNWDNKLSFNENGEIALYYTNTLSWICIVLAHWNNSPRLDMSLHWDTLSWFRPNHYLFLLLNDAVLSGEATNTNLIVFGLTQPGLEPTIYRIRGEHTNHYRTDAYFVLKNVAIF